LYNILLLVLILSVTLSTTRTEIVYWRSTVSGVYDICVGTVYSISSTSCYNTLEWYIDIDGIYIHTNVYYAYTTKAYSSMTYSSTLMYFTTIQGYTNISEISTLTISYSITYINSFLITITDTMTNKDTFTNYETYIQYSTITRIVAPSPSIVPKNKCTCIIPLCNKLDLVLLTINNIV
jgi:hypothetical protein